MKTSESQSSLVKSLMACQKKFPAFPKTKEGQVGNRKFKYAPLDDLMDKVRPLLLENGLLLTQGTEGHQLVTRLDHDSGEWRECVMPVNEQQSSDQAYGIELSYKRRYSMQLMLGIVTEDDVDGNTKSFRSSPTMGVFNTLPAARKAVVNDVCDAVNEHMADNDVAGAFEEASGLTDSEEKTALWGMLDSRTRSAIKKYGEQLRKEGAA